MKIVFDGQTTEINKSGFGSYVDNLAKGLKRIGNNIDISFVSPGTEKDLSTPHRILWDQFLFPRRARKIKPDIIHKPSFSAPFYPGTKTVLTVHDLIPLIYPENFSRSSAFFYNKIMTSSFRHADKIITVSEHSKTDMVRLLNIKPEKITVIPLASAEEFRVINDKKKIGKVKNKYGISGNYMLNVGTLEPRKNLDFLIKVFAEISNEDRGFAFQLAITGKKGWRYERLFEQVEKNNLKDKVIFTGYVEERDLPYLYNGASIFLFPSIYEGFGLPPLEAMACGLPVISSNSSSLPEVCGDSAVLLSPTDFKGWVRAIKKIANDNKLRGQLSTGGLIQSQKFSWDKTAKETLKVYRKVLDD